MKIFFIIMLLDILLPFLIAMPYKGYRHKITVMSVLGCSKSPLRWLYNLWTILSGCAFIVLGYFLHTAFAGIESSLSVILWVLLALYGIGDEILSGIFPVNEQKGVKTISSKIHGIGSVAGFIALQLAPLFLGILQLSSGRTAAGVLSFLCFALSLVSFVFFVMGEKPKFHSTVLSYEGLWQRVSLILMYLPFALWSMSEF